MDAAWHDIVMNVAGILRDRRVSIAEVTSEGPWDMGTAFDAIERELAPRVAPPRS